MGKALITGITGQDGAYLAKYLLDKKYEVVGITRDSSKNNMKNLRFLGIDNSVSIIEANMLDLSNIIRIVGENGYDEIYNLAAQSSVGLSFAQPIGTIEFNVISVANILEAVRIIKPTIKFYQASSSEMFGRVSKDRLPVNENSIFSPVSPYGISKASAHWITINYREAYGLFAVCGILFNHESALRPNNFVTKKILNTALRIKMGIADKLTLGNINICRDWGYAPEYVKAMWKMLQQDRADDYVVCSGDVHSLEEFTRMIFNKLGLEYENFVKIDKGLYRPVELESIYGDSSKAQKLLQWHYNMDFETFIEKLIADETLYLEWIKRGNFHD